MPVTRRDFLGLLSAAALSCGSRSFAGEKKSMAPAAPLAFRDGTFKILQLTDMHVEYRGNDGNEKAAQTLDLVRQLLKIDRPDLTVITGDIVSANPENLAGGTEEAWDRIVAPFNEAEMPFAITFGNHDHERKESVAEQLKMVQKSPWCRTFSADETLPGAGNCFLPVYGADGKESRRIWLFDSHSYPARRELSEYDWIKFEQVEWFRRESAQLAESAGQSVPGLAFFHIPLPEYWKVFRAEGSVGSAGENPCSPELNTGLFTAFVENGVQGVFTGHDHVNDYIANYKGVALAYGRKSGFNSYGELPRGGRMIELSEKEPGFVTWLTTPGGTENRWTFGR